MLWIYQSYQVNYRAVALASDGMDAAILEHTGSHVAHITLGAHPVNVFFKIAVRQETCEGVLLEINQITTAVEMLSDIFHDLPK